MSGNFEWQKPENTLQFSTIRDALDELLKATENKIQREWPPQLGSGDWHSIPFLFFLKNARWTYVATLDLLADKPEDKKWHLEYAVVIPPLNRTILDMVFNFQKDPPTRLSFLLKLGRFPGYVTCDPG